MKKDIHKQLSRMIVVIVTLLGFAAWQHDFILDGIQSSAFLNTTILATFAFGVAMTFKDLFDLDNERIAVQALQESYDDLLHRSQDEIDPHRRFRRREQPAIIFTHPRIMGQTYSLLADEMSRSGDLKLSAGAMQTLMDGIDARLDDQRSLVNYITGLQVFLGLIGTFVGLMMTLASVGHIIGDLDLSGGGGAATIQRLMENLKTPLQGMATGFSSSLFGLVTSLALGLIGRFRNSAATSMKLSFEAWLSSVVHITDSGEERGGAATVSERGVRAFGEQHLRLMYNVARYSLTSSNRTNRILDAMSAAVTGLSEEQRKQTEATHRIAALVEKGAQYQSLMSYHLGRTADALANHDEMALTLKEIEASVISRLDELSRSANRASGNIEQLTEEIIRLGEGGNEDNLDHELKRMMGEIDQAFARDRIDRAVADAGLPPELLAAKGPKQSPAAAAVAAATAQPQPQPRPRARTVSADPVGEMRDLLRNSLKGDGR